MNLENSTVLNSTSLNLAHNDFFEHLRNIEFSRLNKNNETYLDFMGGNLYPESLVSKHHDWLLNNVMGNPHSMSGTSMRSSALLEESRQAVLDFFNAKDYVCIFTANATASLKIIGDGYPFDSESTFLITEDNHNSVNGIREYCLSGNGKVEYLTMEPKDLTIPIDELKSKLASKKGENNLFAYPAQSNVSGVKHPLEYINLAHQYGWDVLLDSAAYVSSSPLDLSQINPDFVSISFYKIFGYPTGIGCLLVHKSKFHKLGKRAFTGGNVNFVSVKSCNFHLSPSFRKFEDGTVNYLGIPAIKWGLEFIQQIGGTSIIRERINSIRIAVYAQLQSLKHSNGQALIKFYGKVDSDQMGNTMVMNFYKTDGSFFAIERIQELATERQISIRTGCFCNPGLDELIHNVDKDTLKNQFKDVLANPEYESFPKKFNRGSVRISFGVATSQKDLHTLFDFANSLVDLEH